MNDNATPYRAAKYRYDAFGNIRESDALYTPRYLFSTKEYLPDAKLYLYAYRVYDPIAGRWTQRDPIDYQDSINLYQFCGNNSICAVDIDGRAVDIPIWVGVSLGVLGGGAIALGIAFVRVNIPKDSWLGRRGLSAYATSPFSHAKIPWVITGANYRNLCRAMQLATDYHEYYHHSCGLGELGALQGQYAMLDDWIDAGGYTGNHFSPREAAEVNAFRNEIEAQLEDSMGKEAFKKWNDARIAQREKNKKTQKLRKKRVH